MPRVPIRSFSMHGGAGAVLSIGLMRAISLEWFEDCVHNAYSTGGDAIISMCLWEVSDSVMPPPAELLTLSWQSKSLKMAICAICASKLTHMSTQSCSCCMIGARGVHEGGKGRMASRLCYRCYTALEVRFFLAMLPSASDVQDVDMCRLALV